MVECGDFLVEEFGYFCGYGFDLGVGVVVVD